jgi:hydrogenase maturation protease
MIRLIGYGNPGRGDDGLGPALAARIADVPGLDVSHDYQLTVDHALMIADADRVIFVDALLRSGAAFEFGPTTASTSHDVTSHSLSPQAVLALCKTLYSRAPKAFVLGITGHEFGEVKEGLSCQAETNLALAEAFLRDWLAGKDPAPPVGGLVHA